MRPGDPSNGESFATITAASPSSVRQSDARDALHRSGPFPSSSRRMQPQQSDVGCSQSVHQRPPLTRGQSQIQQAIASSAKFVGIPYAERTPDLSEWDSRRLRFLNKRYKLKDTAVKTVQQPQHEIADSGPASNTPVTLETPSADQRFSTAGTSVLVRTASQESRPPPRLEKKDSVAKVVYNAFSSIIKRGTISRPKPRNQPLSQRSSFDTADLDEMSLPPVMHSPGIETVPEELSEVTEEEEMEKPKTEEPIVEPEGDWVELTDLSRPTNLSTGTRPLLGSRRRFRGFESLPTLYDDEGNPIPRPRHCFAQLKVSSGPPLDEEDDGHKPASRKSQSWAAESRKGAEASVPLTKEEFLVGVQDSQFRTHVPVPFGPDFGSPYIHGPPQKVSLAPQQPTDDSREPDRASPFRNFGQDIQRKVTLTKQPAVDLSEEAFGNKILEIIAEGVVPRRQRRYRGVGPIGRMFNHNLEEPEVKKLNPQLQQLLERGEDHRPFFTYWVTTVQVLVCIISLCFYGFGPFNLFERVERIDEVLDVSLASRRVSYFEPANIWLGPRFADLVRLGAKYSPCMRRERGIWNEIDTERKKENHTGCCIFNDRTGCYQTSENGCPRTLATWVKWSKPRSKLTRTMSDSHLLRNNHTKLTIFNTIPHHRQAGAVCGQDPDFCVLPRSVKLREWEDDLTKWPICKETRTEGVLPPHMTCQVTGRPCCIQMQGLCRITTKEYCEFVQGYYHSNATLCSQVDCFGDICGMLPFVNKDHPNQFYRLFTSLFIHAGLVHLLITMVVHKMFMVDLEALIGWKRMAIVYLGSGIGGNLASAIFVPYNPEVGPSGSQLGILAAMIVDVAHHRKFIFRYHYAILEHLVFVFLLLAAGTVPYVDNWAHIFGFIFGFLITLIVFPYIDLANENTLSATLEDLTKLPNQRKLLVRRRTLLVMASSIAVACLFLFLGYIYFSNAEINCPICQYFNCINYFLTDHYCDNKGLELSHWLPI